MKFPQTGKIERMFGEHVFGEHMFGEHMFGGGWDAVVKCENAPYRRFPCGTPDLIGSPRRKPL